VRLDPTKVKARREALELTQEDLATKAGVSVDSIRRAENGFPVSDDTVQSIGADLGVDYHVLLQSADAKPLALPYLSLGTLFKGRDDFLAELHQSLNRGTGRTAITGSTVYGLGGVGKTRAAVEYAWAHHESFAAVLFVVGDTTESLRRNIAGLSLDLRLTLPEEEQTGRISALPQLLIGSINTPDG
jgi:transcriptional regulator with XRE-family HTH domain